MALTMLVSAFLGQSDPLLARKGPRLAAGLVGLGLTWLLLMGRSRGPTVATLVALTLLLLLSPHRGRRRLAYLAAAVGITAFVVFLFAGGWAQLESWVLRGETVERVASLSQRSDLFRIGWELFALQPVFGYGYMQTGARLSNYFSWAGHGHNVLTEIVVSMGLVGLFAFLVLIGVALTRLWRGMRIPPIRGSGLPAEGLTLLAFLLLQGVVSDSFGGPVGFETAGLMLVVLIASWSSHMPTSQPAPSAHAGPRRRADLQRRRLLTER
ncbi:MAG: hypothetical protein A2V75_04610 [Actinobacteria bacterium RBG_16_70_17]|nr:MAG: hypothetical protein A2V75_04610 [Actinobacteria bacterium RBG_16_70_17]